MKLIKDNTVKQFNVPTGKQLKDEKVLIEISLLELSVITYLLGSTSVHDKQEKLYSIAKKGIHWMDYRITDITARSYGHSGTTWESMKTTLVEALKEKGFIHGKLDD